MNVPGFLITAVTLRDSPEAVLGRNPVLEVGLRKYFSCSPKFHLNTLVGQSEMMNLRDYLILRLECLLFVTFFSYFKMVAQFFSYKSPFPALNIQHKETFCIL